jgi:hypothetical protein
LKVPTGLRVTLYLFLSREFSSDVAIEFFEKAALAGDGEAWATSTEMLHCCEIWIDNL